MNRYEQQLNRVLVFAEVHGSASDKLAALEVRQQCNQVAVERDQLSAQVERLRAAIEIYDETGFPEVLEKAIEETPAQSLAEVEAAAIERTACYLDERPEGDENLVILLENFADKIRTNAK